MLAAAGFLLIMIGLVHSLLGERLIIGPLCAADWPKLRLPPAFARRVLRFAWHVTTVSWLGAGLGLVWSAFGAVPVVELVAATALATGALILFASRGAHLAWPVFLAVGILLLQAAAPAWWSMAGRGIAAAGMLLLALAALVHAFWAFGGRFGLGPAIPTGRDGAPAFRPGRSATLLVALGLALVSAVFAIGLGWLPVARASWMPWLFALLALGFSARLMGDFRYVGLFKRVRGTAFARLDDGLFGPLLFVFALGAALLAAG